MVEMKHASYRVFVKCSSRLAVPECAGSAVLKAGDAQILPQVGLGSFATPGRVHTQSPEQACGTNPTLATASGDRYVSRALPAGASSGPLDVLGTGLKELRQGLALRSPEAWILIANGVTEERGHEGLHPVGKRGMAPEIRMSLAHRHERWAKGPLAALGRAILRLLHRTAAMPLSSANVNPRERALGSTEPVSPYDTRHGIDAKARAEAVRRRVPLEDFDSSRTGTSESPCSRWSSAATMCESRPSLNGMTTHELGRSRFCSCGAKYFLR